MKKYRYRLSGTMYIPEMNTDDKGWHTISGEKLSPTLKNLAYELAGQSIKTRGRFDNQYVFENTGDVFFAEKYLVMAFIGAMQAIYEPEVREVCV